MPSVLTLAMVAAIALAFMFGAMAAMGWKGDRFANFGQGVAGVATVIALTCAAALYYSGREDKPRLVVQKPQAVVAAAQDGVLLHIAVAIENKSAQRLKIMCAAIDLIGLEKSGRRHNRYYDDLLGQSLLRDQPGRDAFRRCVGTFEARRRNSERQRIEERGLARRAGRDREPYVNDPRVSEPARSGARFTDFVMEPGESVTKTWDQFVTCDHAAVQVIFKVPRPDDIIDYEAKTLVPLDEICARVMGERAAVRPHPGPLRASGAFTFRETISRSALLPRSR